jgi:RNA ligase (TIGR02306 family)
MPISILPSVLEYPVAIEEGTDVTELLGVTKYEPEVPACLGGEVRGARPSYTIKTDEDRIQAYPELIEEFNGKMVYVSQKIDGTSGTFSFMDGDFQVSGRNWSYKECDNTYWKIAKKYNIEAKLKDIHERSGGHNYTIQAEIAGPKIQDNPLGLKDHELFIFNVMNLNQGKFLNFYEFKEFCEVIGVPTVPILMICSFKWNSIDKLLEMADEGKYPNGHPQEGVVIRPLHEFDSKVLGGRASFKVISNKYLQKTGK